MYVSVLHVYSTGRGRIPGTGCIERVVSCHTGAGSAQPSLQPLPSLFVPINLLSCNYRAVIRIGIGCLNLVMQTRIALMIIAFFSLSLTWSLLGHCTHVILTKLILGTFYSICWYSCLKQNTHHIQCFPL